MYIGKKIMNLKSAKIFFLFFFVLFLISQTSQLFAQVKPEKGDPANPSDIPGFFKSKLSDIDAEIEKVNLGEVKTIAISPGGLPVYAVFYGEKEDLKSQANYNSAIGARNPAYYALKDSSTKPVVLFVGPVHGQEIENIAGLVNLIHIAETGKDYRGKEWPELKRKIEMCRTIIIPSGNPDGRRRCPYDGFIGLPTKIMTKYGQGTRKDSSLYGWPGAKSVHPMKGDVGILGAYFNDDGINPMHDDFFAPMAKETKAILDIARSEAPDITVSLHSHENKPMILQPAYLPMYLKEKVHQLAVDVNKRYKENGIWNIDTSWFWEPQPDGEIFKSQPPFNLIGALHHVSGTMSFTFECSHGSRSERFPEPMVSYENILDIQLLLYDEMFDYILKNRIYWNLPPKK